MLQPVTIPDVGAAGAVLKISAWFVEPNERVAAGDSLIELAMSGITCDVPAPCSGRLARIEKSIDAAVETGTTVGWIETDE